MEPSPRIGEALLLLLAAHEYAQDLRCSIWDFALEISALRERGLTNNDLRWLVYSNYLQHKSEVAILSAAGEPSPRAGRLPLCEQSCFVLTPEGLRFARSWLGPEKEVRLPGPHCPPPASLPGPSILLPRWDSDRRELRLGDLLVKQFKVPAANQEIILSAFQEEMWPACIDDPLPPHTSIDPKRRLHDTLGSLNRNQKQPLMRFLGNGNGEGVRWEAVAKDADKARD